ncbi:Voltage-gated potassium channel Kch [Pseudobythopirellula maris]|uniref:Voltage-gated potassium channel Kch n=1 Tax=Pseudobythopirellula maris TaxID=2527991 RepID=A0A5C5ZUU6_9BACT|nr:potassium channel protein [Pseudobythopirellula maris]TWT90747.1 Voltage-gated potassium channel Kch [Pseudobythopirellula maris]
MPVTLLHRIRRGVTFLGGFLVVAIVGYKFLTGGTWLDAVYFTVITVSTVGYGERSEVGPVVQLFTIAVILLGVAGVAYTFGLVVQSMVEGQINRALGLRRMTREIEHLTGHAIICGYGRIGQTLAQELARRDKPFVLIDQDLEITAAAADDGLLVVTGDATDEDVLLDAGILRANTVVVALKSDADNVFLTLTARNLNRKLKIIARGELAATEKKLLQAGADRVVLPAVIGARRMAALVTRPHAAELLEHFTDHEKLDAQLEELLIVPPCDMIGQSVREAAARQRHKLLVIGIRRADGRMLFNPEPDDRFENEDTLVVMGRRTDIEAFQRLHKI